MSAEAVRIADGLLDALGTIAATPPRRLALGDEIRGAASVIAEDHNVGERLPPTSDATFPTAPGGISPSAPNKQTALARDPIGVGNRSPAPAAFPVRIARPDSGRHARGRELLLVYVRSPNPCLVGSLRARWGSRRTDRQTPATKTGASVPGERVTLAMPGHEYSVADARSTPDPAARRGTRIPRPPQDAAAGEGAAPAGDAVESEWWLGAPRRRARPRPR